MRDSARSRKAVRRLEGIRIGNKTESLSDAIDRILPGRRSLSLICVKKSIARRRSMHYERTPRFTRLKLRVASAAHQTQNG